MPERTENDIALGRGIIIRIGGVDHEIAPPPIDQESAWHERLSEVLSESAGALRHIDTSGGTAALESLVKAIVPIAFTRGPTWMRGIVAAYAPEIAMEIAGATAAEAIAAFRAILELERPFFVEWAKLLTDLFALKAKATNGTRG